MTDNENVECWGPRGLTSASERDTSPPPRRIDRNDVRNYCCEAGMIASPHPCPWHAVSPMARVAELEAALQRIIDHKVRADGHIVRIAEDALKGNDLD